MILMRTCVWLLALLFIAPLPVFAATPSDKVTLVFDNKLIASVNITVNGEVVGSVPAEEIRQIEIDPVESLTVEWSLIRPMTTDEIPVGDKMSGKFGPSSNPSETQRFTIDNIAGDEHFFAPVITNTTDVDLLMGVNMGLQAENRCECTVPAQTSEVLVGYYRFFSNSTVRAYRDGSNYTGSFTFWDDIQTESLSGKARLSVSTPPPLPSPDLTGTIIKLKAKQRNAGDHKVTVKLQVRNDGAEIARGPFSISLFLSDDAAFDVNDDELLDTRIVTEDLLPGETTDVIKLKRKGLPPVTGFVIVVIDDDNNVAESDEPNNILVQQIVGLNQIQIDSLSATSALPASLLTITGSGFDPDAELSVRFFDDQRFDVDVPVVGALATSLIVSVPPFIDPTTDTFGAGMVNVQVVKRSTTETLTSNTVNGLAINDLPSVTAPRGVTTVAYLDAVIQLLRDSIDHESLLETASNGEVSTPEVIANLNRWIADYTEIKKEVESIIADPTTSIVFAQVNGESLHLDIETLAVIDRLVGSLMQQLESVQPGTADEELFNLEGLLLSQAIDRVRILNGYTGAVTSTLSLSIEANSIKSATVTDATCIIPIPSKIIDGLLWAATTLIPAASGSSDDLNLIAAIHGEVPLKNVELVVQRFFNKIAPSLLDFAFPCLGTTINALGDLILGPAGPDEIDRLRFREQWLAEMREAQNLRAIFQETRTKSGPELVVCGILCEEQPPVTEEPPVIEEPPVTDEPTSSDTVTCENDLEISTGPAATCECSDLQPILVNGILVFQPVLSCSIDAPDSEITTTPK